MKTSYKLLIVAALILFGTLTAHDFALKAEYEKGTYKNEFRDYTKLSYKDFDQIEINPANKVNVDIIYSDTFSVSLANSSKEYLKIRQEGTKLIVDLDLKERDYLTSSKSLIIRCPVMKVVRTNAMYTFQGKQIIGNKSSENRRIEMIGDNSTGSKRIDMNGAVASSEGITIRGFKQDSLKLIINNVSTINLKNNKLNDVTASVGAGKSGGSSLNINKSNQINSATIDLQNKSWLSLNDINVDHFNLKKSDSAQLYLSGASLKLLKDKK